MTSAEIETLRNEVLKELRGKKKFCDKAWYIYRKKPERPDNNNNTQ